MKKTSIKSIIIWFIVTLFYAYQNILRVMPGIIMDDLVERFSISATTFGQFAGLYYLSYSFLHIPIGILLDKYNPKKIIPICIILTVIGQLPFIISNNWFFFIIGRVIVGGASSGAILGVFRIIRLTFDQKYFTRMLSISVTIGLIGAIYGGGPLSKLCSIFSYEFIIKALILKGLILSILSYLLIPSSKTNNLSIKLILIYLFKNKKVLAACIFSGMLIGPLEGFADIWAPKFLSMVYNLSDILCASIPSMIFAGFCFGGPLLSLVAEKTNRYFGTIIFAGIFMTTVFILLCLRLLNIKTMTILFFLVGLCSAYQIIAIYKISTLVKENAISLTTAFVNMVIMSFGYIFHTIIGSTVHIFGGIKNPTALVYGVSAIPIILILGVVGFTFLSIKLNSK